MNVPFQITFLLSNGSSRTTLRKMCCKTRRRFKKTTTSISKRLHEMKNDLPEMQRGRRARKGAANVNLQVCATS